MNYLGYTIFDEESVVSNFDALLNKLSQENQSVVLAYKFERDRQATLFGKLLLEKILRDQFKLNAVPEIRIEEHGRPSFLNSTLDFNISHSGKYVICLVSDEARVGVDVEKHRQVTIDNFNKYFTDKEWKEIYSYSEPLIGFFDFWSMKESVIKADGRGVSILQKTEKQRAGLVLAEEKNWYVKQLKLSNDYSTFISSSNQLELTIAEIKTSEL